MTERYSIPCPTCWETFEIDVNTELGNQCWVEDCWVCCNPMTVVIKVNGDDIDARAYPGNE